MVTFHDGMPRIPPDKYILLAMKPDRTQAEWWNVVLTVHQNDMDTFVETLDERMTLEGAKSRAKQLAVHKSIADIIILKG